MSKVTWPVGFAYLFASNIYFVFHLISDPNTRIFADYPFLFKFLERQKPFFLTLFWDGEALEIRYDKTNHKVPNLHAECPYLFLSY